MPRRARLAIPGIPWHIIQRGNNRSACFYAEADYRRYLYTLREQAQKHGCLIHAYVLMTNHVRAAMVAHPGDYKWSSYQANGEGRPDLLVTPHADYLRLSLTDESRREAYRKLFKAHRDPELIAEIRTATNGNFVLGSERFKEDVACMLKRRVVPGKSGRPLARRG